MGDMTMQVEQDLKENARRQARDLITRMGESFRALPRDRQEDIYREVYQASYDRLALRRQRLAQQRANGELAQQTAYNPKDPTDPANFENRRIEQAGQLAGEFIESVDFPGFVRDLTLAVFRGNLEVQHQQTDDFIKLLKAASGSLSKFVQEIDDFSAYSRLAENEPDRFQIAQLPEAPELPGEEGGARPVVPTAPATPVLMDRAGNEVDVTDNAIQAKILETKIAMAQENRALLREVLLMGITRMVIKGGEIQAACVFDIKAKEAMTRQAMRQNERVTTTGGNLGGSMGWGPFSVGLGGSRARRETEISVSSAAGRTSTDLAAKITGSVSLKIESDYFKLDNFADMYRQIATGGQGVTTSPAPVRAVGAAPSTPAGGAAAQPVTTP